MNKVTSDIAQSATLPASFYFDPAIWERMKEAVFAKRWLFIGDEKELFNVAINTHPLFLLDKYIEEPLVLTKVENEIRCLSNVCTHRGFIVAHHPGKNRKLTCTYHGRRFDLKGKFEFMPEFKEVANFPLNIVRPYTSNFTKVEFLYYIKDRDIWNRMQGDQIGEKTQQEDEWVVEGVQKGLRSRFYTDGRFSAKRERGVHHFHQLLKGDLERG